MNADRFFPGYSKGLYEEVEEEIKDIKKSITNGNQADILLIKTILQDLLKSCQQHYDLIFEVLERIERRKQQEIQEKRRFDEHD